MKKVVIAGSASLQDEIMKWREYWENQENHLVINYPVPIEKENFANEYPKVHKEFFESILKADILFIANEDKKGIQGYIGAEVFAELVYGLMQNFLSNHKVEVILAKMPSSDVQSFEEVELWMELGWIRVL